MIEKLEGTEKKEQTLEVEEVRNNTQEIINEMIQPKQDICETDTGN